jgi:hypothetical protein
MWPFNKKKDKNRLEYLEKEYAAVLQILTAYAALDHIFLREIEKTNPGHGIKEGPATMYLKHVGQLFGKEYGN